MGQLVKGTVGLVNREWPDSFLRPKSADQLGFMFLAVQKNGSEEDKVSPFEPAWGGGVLLKNKEGMVFHFYLRCFLLPSDCADQEQILDSELWDLLKCVTLPGY